MVSVRDKITEHQANKIRENVRVLGSHWNRNTIKDATVKWNPELGKWEAELTRHLGFFDSASEAGDFLSNHLSGVEEWFLDRLENGEGSVKVLGVQNKGRDTNRNPYIDAPQEHENKLGDSPHLTQDRKVDE